VNSSDNPTIGMQSNSDKELFVTFDRQEQLVTGL